MDEYPHSYIQFTILFLLTIFLFTKGIYYFLKYPKYQNTLAKTFILFIIISFCANGILRSFQYSDKKLKWDIGIERQVINAAQCYYDKGFSSNFGLPDNFYPKGTNIYTHFPPGPHLFAGLLFKICGGVNLICPRILTTIISSLALLFFAIMLYSSIGPFKSAVLMFLVALLPMTRNMLYALHTSNYVISLFIVQLGFLLYLFKKKINLNIYHLTIFFILGFIQGWLSLDNFFIVCLSPLCFAILFSDLSPKEDKRRLILATLSLFIGICVAYLLHFIQNSLYFGSSTRAFEDLFNRAAYRSSSALEGEGWKITRISILMDYLFYYPRSWYLFAINYPIFIGVTLILIWFKDIRLTMQNPIKLNVTWKSSRRNYLVVLTALISSLLFVFIFYHYAASEFAYYPRILFFPYVICILTILECIKVDIAFYS
jgi:hypothetical protein